METLAQFRIGARRREVAGDTHGFVVPGTAPNPFRFGQIWVSVIRLAIERSRAKAKKLVNERAVRLAGGDIDQPGKHDERTHDAAAGDRRQDCE